MSGLHYGSVHEELIVALPELARPYHRLFEDWDNFGNEPPGQYIVASDTYGTLLEVALSLPEGTAGREELLRRALEFGEAMLASQDGEVHALGIDALAERLDAHPDGRTVAQRLGGQRLRAWFSIYSTSDRDRRRDDEIIDLWGVREAMVPLLPTTPPHELPGISYPASSPDLKSLEEARATPDGAVMLAAYGTTHLCAVVRATDIRAKPPALDALAAQLAAILGHPKGEPRAQYRRIPRGERVWNMHLGDQRHSRLWDEPWVAGPVSKQGKQILAVAHGKAGPPTIRQSLFR